MPVFYLPERSYTAASLINFETSSGVLCKCVNLRMFINTMRCRLFPFLRIGYNVISDILTSGKLF